MGLTNQPILVRSLTVSITHPRHRHMQDQRCKHISTATCALEQVRGICTISNWWLNNPSFSVRRIWGYRERCVISSKHKLNFNFLTSWHRKRAMFSDATWWQFFATWAWALLSCTPKVNHLHRRSDILVRCRHACFGITLDDQQWSPTAHLSS